MTMVQGHPCHSFLIAPVTLCLVVLLLDNIVLFRLWLRLPRLQFMLPD